MRKCTICLCVGFLMCLACLRTQAQETEPTEREKELLRRLEQLEKRVSQLETELRETKARPPEAPAALTNRVADVENKVEVGLARVGAVEEEVKKMEPAEEKPDTFRVFWKEGLKMETADSAFKMNTGGRIHLDNAWTSGDDQLVEEFGSLKDGVEFRRAIFGVSGSI